MFITFINYTINTSHINYITHSDEDKSIQISFLDGQRLLNTFETVELKNKYLYKLKATLVAATTLGEPK